MEVWDGAEIKGMCAVAVDCVELRLADWVRIACTMLHEEHVLWAVALASQIFERIGRISALFRASFEGD
jgi:hypothetical protein